jgi:hypothetical protein
MIVQVAHQRAPFYPVVYFDRANSIVIFLIQLESWLTSFSGHHISPLEQVNGHPWVLCLLPAHFCMIQNIQHSDLAK